MRFNNLFLYLLNAKSNYKYYLFYNIINFNNNKII